MQWRVFDDRPFEFLLKIVKKDAQTGNTVLKAGASYKIYDCLLYTSSKSERRKVMAEMKNICRKIPMDLHEKVREEIELTESSTCLLYTSRCV